MLLEFAQDGSQRYWFVVLGFVFISLLEDRSNVSCFHSSGTEPCDSDTWKRSVLVSVTCKAVSLRRRDEIPSGPVALWTLRFFSSLYIPDVPTRISGIASTWLLLLLESIALFSDLVNNDEN